MVDSGGFTSCHFICSYHYSSIEKATDKQQEEVSQLNAYLDEKISGQKAIIVEGLQEDSIDGFLKHNENVKNVLLLLKHGLV